MSDRWDRESEQRHREIDQRFQASMDAHIHDFAAAVLACAVEDGIITSDQRLALLENWIAWSGRPSGTRSEADARRIRGAGEGR